MSRSSAKLAQRKAIDTERLLSACTGKTCTAIADELGEDPCVVRRQLLALAQKRMVSYELIRGYVRYRRLS